MQGTLPHEVYKDDGGRTSRPLLSVIVPAWNEERTLPAALSSVVAPGVATEVIVADGGSTDATRSVARDLGAKVTTSPRGRGNQLRAGADLARGNVLLFLHADTVLPLRGIEAVVAALQDPATVGGRFRLAFDRSHPVLRMIAFASRGSGRLTSFGDSALFVRRAVYDRLGGFEPVPLFEDVRFYRKLKQAGRVRVLPLAVVTSSRRFIDRGPGRQLLRNAGLLLAHEMGVSPRLLARRYERGRPALQDASIPTENPNPRGVPREAIPPDPRDPGPPERRPRRGRSGPGAQPG